MKTALITGANKGIGLETAKQLAMQGIFVYIGTRNLENGQKAVGQLKSEGITNVEAVQLDVTSHISVDNARKEIGNKTDVLDILINNAGISGISNQHSLECSIDDIKVVFETNYYGAIRVSQTLVDLLRKSPEPRIVNVSSGMASQTFATDPKNPFYLSKSTAYQSSKTALNMYTITLAFDLRDTNFKINSVCPGYINTAFNGHQGTGTVEEGANRITKYALIDQKGPTGKFFCEMICPDTECPW